MTVYTAYYDHDGESWTSKMVLAADDDEALRKAQSEEQSRAPPSWRHPHGAIITLTRLDRHVAVYRAGDEAPTPVRSSCYVHGDHEGERCPNCAKFLEGV